MTEPPIKQYAGDLTCEEEQRCRAIAWRFVHADILGRYGGRDVDGFTDADAGGLWDVAHDDIHDPGEMASVLEILAGIISMAMVEKDGRANALRTVKEEIAKTDPTWPS